ncbi:MAG TPA: hypothetical protein PL110_07850 [Candidatus Eremiobacteraeota bacterium]|nr:MAG: hypothetical protein BWY64_01229 [bacterium ADurb.Bin363]HPZ08011.1 hypothetical protein [Candidatus Eremiobacteraeota bacterium]
MSENKSSTIQEELSSDIDKEGKSDFSFNTMVGVALIGAISSVTLYYIYTQLSQETKKSLRETILGSITKKVVQLTCEEK